jgi:hypothetical protein
VEYKFWIERNRPFPSIRDELATLARQGEHFRRLIEPKAGDPIAPLATFLKVFDVGTAYPLLLFLLDAELSDSDWVEASSILESYLLRRAVCNLTTKALNRVFLVLTRALARDGATPTNIRTHLVGLKGDSSEWPTDANFAKAWQELPAYHVLQNARLVHILKRLSGSYFGTKAENITIDQPLTIEHIMPQQWIENWPLPDSSVGLTAEELWTSGSNDERAAATHRRESLIQTFGNLTIITQELNSSVSNSAWAVKKPELLASSLLPINQQLYPLAKWDEEAIEHRSQDLLKRAIKIWPSPKV